MKLTNSICLQSLWWCWEKVWFLYSVESFPMRMRLSWCTEFLSLTRAKERKHLEEQKDNNTTQQQQKMSLSMNKTQPTHKKLMISYHLNCVSSTSEMTPVRRLHTIHAAAQHRKWISKPLKTVFNAFCGDKNANKL